MSKKTFAFTAVCLILVVMLSGCIDLYPPPDPTPSGLTLKLTDPTVTDLDQIWVIITQIEVYPKGDNSEEKPIFVFEGELDVDLLDIQYPETVTVVSNIELPPGDYGHLKLYLKQLDGLYHGVEVTKPGYHALAFPKEGDGDPFLCVVPPEKFNVQIWDPVEGKNTHFTKEEGVAITVIIDFRWNGNVASNPDHNMDPSGKAYVETVILPDITITKTGPTEVVEGSDAKYTITISFEDADATGVTIVDTIPDGMSYVSCSYAGVYSYGKVTWHFSHIDTDTTPEIIIVLTLKGDVAAEKTKTNTVSVTCAEGVYAEAAAETLVTAP